MKLTEARQLSVRVSEAVEEELKNKLREDLKEELIQVQGSADKFDCFESVYECIHTRMHLLNIISFNSRGPVEPDIDLAILQALLNGKKKLLILFC